jgi:hypothetical protein
MKLKSTILLAVSMAMGLSTPVLAGDNGGGKHFILNVIGTGYQYTGLVPDLDNDGVEDEALCFDVALVDGKNRRILGTATDCLAEISDQTASGNIMLTGTTFFHLRNGTLITRGKTTVAPVEQKTITPYGQAITHITGAAGTGNAIIGGTGRFADRTGTARLSGMVDLSGFGAAHGDPIAFDCLFMIDLD